MTVGGIPLVVSVVADEVEISDFCVIAVSVAVAVPVVRDISVKSVPISPENAVVPVVEVLGGTDVKFMVALEIVVVGTDGETVVVRVMDVVVPVMILEATVASGVFLEGCVIDLAVVSLMVVSAEVA